MLFKKTTPQWLVFLWLFQLGLSGCALAEVKTQSNYTPTPNRKVDTGAGPHERLIIRGATVIDGTGAPPMGPMDIVIENNRIVDIVSVGYPLAKIDASKRPQNASYEIDAHGAYVMPGLVDLHVHALSNKITPPEDIYKLWLAHGITTVRGVSLGPLGVEPVREKAQRTRNDITAPRIFAYQVPGQGEAWEGKKIQTPGEAKKWVKYAANDRCMDGLKLSSYRPAIMQVHYWMKPGKQKLGSTAHLHQTGVAQMNALGCRPLRAGVDDAFLRPIPGPLQRS